MKHRKSKVIKVTQGGTCLRSALTMEKSGLKRIEYQQLGASLVAQMVKHLPAIQRTWVLSLD